MDLLNRIAARFLGATVWYVPFDEAREARRPWMLWGNRVTHPLPFVALVILILAGIHGRLHRTTWIAIDPPTGDNSPQEGVINVRDFSIRGESELQRVAANDNDAVRGSHPPGADRSASCRASFSVSCT